MYSIYCKLRDSRNVKDSQVANATGIGKSTFSDWKSGRSTPKSDKLQKIADYFGVSLVYLMTGKEDPKEITLTAKYEVFEKLLAQRGVTAYRVAKETGITTATLSNWKQGKYTPKSDKLQKIADYFGVSLDYLMTGKEEEQKEITLTTKDERDIAKRLEKTLAELEDMNEGLMFSGEPLDDETRELLKASLENSIRIAKINAKQKYTPKKYR